MSKTLAGEVLYVDVEAEDSCTLEGTTTVSVIDGVAAFDLCFFADGTAFPVTTKLTFSLTKGQDGELFGVDAEKVTGQVPVKLLCSDKCSSVSLELSSQTSGATLNFSKGTGQWVLRGFAGTQVALKLLSFNR